MSEEERRGETTRERERRLRRAGRLPPEGVEPGGAPPGPGSTNPAYNYRDPGRIGEEGYFYQPGDEFSHPGPEPPRDSPEWPDWKRHAKAWRNYIGGRQRYVDDMISMGYSPEDLGIRNEKHAGQAGYRRLHMAAGEAMGWEYDWARGVKRNIATSDETARDRWIPISADERERHAAGGTRIDELRRNQENWIRDVAAGRQGSLQLDPVTGLYYNDDSSGRRTYVDRMGAFVDAQGRRIGGAYGMEAGQRFATNRHSAEGAGTGSVTGWGTTLGFTPLAGNRQTFGGPQPAQPRPTQSTQSYYQPRPYLREDSGRAWGGWGNPYNVRRNRSGAGTYASRVGQIVPPLG